MADCGGADAPQTVGLVEGSGVRVSPTGPEEWYVFERDNLGTRIQIGLAGGFMISGLAAFLAALWLRWRRRPKVALDISSEGFGVTVYRDANEPKHNKTNASR